MGYSFRQHYAGSRERPRDVGKAKSFANLFFSYFDLYRTNQLQRLEYEAGRSKVPPLTDTEFTTRHGVPPWEFVNHTLRSAGLDFSIDHPQDFRAWSFVPRLTKNTTGADLGFAHLSSGEKIIMSFAFCLYYSLDKRQLVNKPKLLLFDEIDAPLHPSMSRQMIQTISETLVGQHGIHVVLTTHSPSTVAVSPDDSIYVMRPADPGLHSATKRQAISLLTSEIPTLSVTFHGRRQVFVESIFDAERYDTLYRLLSPLLNSPRSLTFISAGRGRVGAGEHCAGCDQVKQVVNALAGAGNDTVFGLIDWDEKNRSEGRVFVLAEGRRYSIETCILDPLLLGAIAIREKPITKLELGLGVDETYMSLPDLSTDRLQKFVDEVQRKVLALTADELLEPLEEVTYLGEFKLQLSLRYLRSNGHELEEAALAAFPHLNKYAASGKLLMRTIDTIVQEVPHFVPMDVKVALEQILNSNE